MSVSKIAEKPRNGAFMDKKRLDYYKKKLQARREELLKTIARTEEEGRSADDDPTVDLADKAANSYTKEFLFGQTNTDRAMLALIDEALERIKNNAYGQCEYCETELQQKRLTVFALAVGVVLDPLEGFVDQRQHGAIGVGLPEEELFRIGVRSL